MLIYPRIYIYVAVKTLPEAGAMWLLIWKPPMRDPWAPERKNVAAKKIYKALYQWL